MSKNLRQFRILHFATHGSLNAEHPELSGLVFSLVDQKGKAVDGFLRLHEIYNLDLDADLVVLSACRTALGREVHGEGLIGLTRGFMYAGASRVVVERLERGRSRQRAVDVAVLRCDAGEKTLAGGRAPRRATLADERSPLVQSPLLGRVRPAGRVEID